MHRLRGTAICAVLALVGSLTAAVTATASQRSTALVLELRPTSDAALHALATATHLSRNERARRVQALVPDAARHATIARTLRDLGLFIDSSSTWSVRVHGAPVTVTSLFGTVPARRGAAGRAYPLVPEPLRPYVVAALPTSGRVASPLSTASPRDGNDFRAAYSAPPGSTGAGLAVATVQLSPWNPTDLSKYAQQHHLTGFNLSKQYVAVAVNNGRTATTTGTPDAGDEEVALDQEAILATAPDATQVAYFAPNDDGGDGYIAAIRLAGKEAAARHTVALSLSWGGCEASDDRTWLAAMDSALAYTLATGVTVFAASGDAGSQDCLGEIGGSAQFAKAVDYPASSPYVVAVGGTTLPPATSTAPALGWSGSGGGESSFEPLPSWQDSVAARSPNNRRLVPDISSDADPNNGICVLDSVAQEPTSPGCLSGEFMLAGTSLASPTQAALLADTLSDAGWTSGVGDIHPALYEAAATDGLTDVTGDDTKNGNGDYHSGVGYDLVTGLGTPVWTALQARLGQFGLGAPRGTRSTSFSIHPTVAGPGVTYSGWSSALLAAPSDCAAATSTTAPTSVQLPADAPDGRYSFWVEGISNTPKPGSCHIGTESVALDRHAPQVSMSVAVTGSGLATVRWSYADTSPSAGLQKFVLAATAGSTTLWTYTTTARSRVFNALPRSKWHLRLTGYDNAGNAAGVTADLYDDSRAFSFGSRWTRVSSSAAYRRSFVRARTAGASTRTSLSGRKFVLYLTMCPTCGRAGIYDGHGHRLATVDTYSARVRYRVGFTVLALSRPAARTLVVTVLSTKNARSRGHDLDVDGIAVF